MIRNFMSRQFLCFLATGGIAAVVNFLSRLLYNQWVGYSAAILLAYVTGMIVAFVLARLFVFQESRQVLHRSALFFLLVNVAALLQTWGIAMGLADYLLPAIGATSFVPEIAHAVGIVVPAFSSYLGHRCWSFRQAGCERGIGTGTWTGPMELPGQAAPLADKRPHCHGLDATAGCPDADTGHPSRGRGGTKG